MTKKHLCGISACTLDCPGCCSLLVTTDDEGRPHVTGNPEHPFTRGNICRKGRRMFERLHSPDRLATPLVRKNGELRPASWEEALALCASRMDALRDTPERMLHIRGFGYRGALAEASRYLFRTLGASTTHGSLCDAAGLEASALDFGVNDQNAPTDISNAAAIVNWGKDLSRSSFHLSLLVRERRKAGVPVLTVSPGGDANDAYSDARIRIRPGTDRFLAAAAIRRLMITGTIPDRLRKACEGYGTMHSLLLAQEESALLRACDATPADVDMLLDWFHRRNGGGATATLLGWGIQRHSHGGENVRWVDALAMLSGNVGCSGGGVYYGISSSRNIDTGWGKQAGTPARSLCLPRLGHELEEATPPVDFIWVDGSNTVNQVPEATRTARAFERCDFKVVVDAFLNDTARRADVVLPCALLLEREDVLGSYQHDGVQYAARIFAAPGLAREDFDIIRDLGACLARPVILPERDAILRRALSTSVLDVSLEELKSRGFVQADRPPVAFEGLRFAHEDEKFHLVDTLSPEPVLTADHPLYLLTVVRSDYLHSQMPEGAQAGLPVVHVAPENTALRALDLTRPLRITSPIGSLAVRLETLPGLHPDAVVMGRGGWMARDWCPNVLIEARLTDTGEGAAYYSQPVRLENF